MPQIMQEQLIVDPRNIDNIAEAKIENRYLPTPPVYTALFQLSHSLDSFHLIIYGSTNVKLMN